MQTIGKLIDHIDSDLSRNYSEYAPALAIGVVLCLLVAIIALPSYEEYCKEPQAQCKEERK